MNNNTYQGNTYERQGMNDTLDNTLGRQQGTMGRQGMNISGEHPSTVNDIQQNIPSHHHTSGQYNANLSGINPNTAHDIGQEDTLSNISSTPSEYGSDDTSHRSPHLGHQQQQQQRPVADRDAFIQEKDTNQYLQNSMNPAERAKELAKEMKNGAVRTASGDEKLLRVGGKKEFNLQ